MNLLTIPSQPIAGQKLGTSGLRKKVSLFASPHYLENFIQAIFNSQPELKSGTLILGGDGRFHNEPALQTILRMAAAHGVAKVMVGRHGLLSTPAASCLIRKYAAQGAIILSASHNPGGPTGDFGVKFNGPNGGPASESVGQAIYAATQSINEYSLSQSADLDLSQLGNFALGEMQVQVIDSVAEYADLMQQLFDFSAIRHWLAQGHKIRLDTLHAVGGPYAVHIFEDLLGAELGSVRHAEPLADFGGYHPDPNPSHCPELMVAMQGLSAPDFAAAFDGDADRNMILGRQLTLSPSDSLAILTANAHLLPQFKQGIAGVARSMPTSRAIDVVAKALNIECFETPTGWKYFGNLLDAGRIDLCGEESYGTGASHVREKDGIWAALAWLNLLAVKNESVQEIVHKHWARFGRHFYSRHDFEGLPLAIGEQIMDGLRARLASLPGQQVAGLLIASADDFAYHDPIDGSVSQQQGLRIEFSSGERVVYRLSGTGTEGATLRVYLERYSQQPDEYATSAQTALSAVRAAAEQLAQISAISGRLAADVVS